MKKILKPKDIFLLSLAEIGNVAQEIKDPLHLVSNAYKNMYGFVPPTYKKHNFTQMVSRAIKTGDIEKIVKKGEVYIRLTTQGKKHVHREFAVLSLVNGWSGKWVMVIFDIPEKLRIQRDRLRIKLRELGFGMLQESIWLTPLPIGHDMHEFIAAKGLGKDVFVMEVSELLAGDPRELARKIWKLDNIEQEYSVLNTALEDMHNSIAKNNDRYKKCDNLEEKKELEKELERAEMAKIRLQRKWLLFIAHFPLLPSELLPPTLKDFWKKKYI